MTADIEVIINGERYIKAPLQVASDPIEMDYRYASIEYYVTDGHYRIVIGDRTLKPRVSDRIFCYHKRHIAVLGSDNQYWHQLPIGWVAEEHFSGDNGL